MPYYEVQVRQDAWINHVGYVNADSPQAAADLALDSWHGENMLDVPLRESFTSEFDHVECTAEDDVEEINEEDFNDIIKHRALANG